MDIEFLSAILRLGKKYEIDYLKEEGLRRLRSEFPLTLEGWDRRNERKNEGCKIININDADIVIEVINLAHELSVETVLPASYLLCVQTTDTVCLFYLNSSLIVNLRLLGRNSRQRYQLMRT